LKSAWVIWRQGRRLILWEGHADLDSSRRTIDLDSNVRLSEDYLNGSTYLVTKAWVDRVTSTCDRFGTKVHVPGG
jgi:hypothetical protein